MSSTPSIAADVSAMLTPPPARPPTSGQQADSPPFADLVDTQGTQPEPAKAPTPPSATGAAAAPGSSSSASSTNTNTLTTPSRPSPAVSSSRAGSGTNAAKGAAGHATTAAGRKLKTAINQAAAAHVHTQTQPPGDSAAANAGNGGATSQTGDGFSQGPNASEPSPQQDSSVATDTNLQLLAAEVVGALNGAAAKGGALAPSDKTAANPSGTPTDRSAKDTADTGSATDGSATAAGDQGQAAANQQAAAAQPAVTSKAQPVAAALVIAAAADTPSPAKPNDAIGAQGGSRGKAIVNYGGIANLQTQDAKDPTALAALPGNSTAASIPRADAAKTSDKTENPPASAAQTAASGASASDLTNPSSTNISSADNNTGPQSQGQPQPAGAPAASFAIVTAGPQSGAARAGQFANDSGATASAGGSTAATAANDIASSSVMPNLGAQAANAANATSAAAAMPPASPIAVPIAGLAVEIAARYRAGSNKFDIRLDPPELGRIDVRLDVDRNGQVTSHVTVDRADTLQLLQSQQPQLQRALEQAGLTTTNNGLQFTLRDQSFAGQNGAGGNGGQPPAPQLVIPDAGLAAIDTAQIYSRWNLGGGLDIRV